MADVVICVLGNLRSEILRGSYARVKPSGLEVEPSAPTSAKKIKFME
jgi:hypothetical protein